MSKDPLDELFGPESGEASKPVPARQRLSHEQAERVKTAPLPTGERSQHPYGAASVQSDPKLGSGGTRYKPWIIVGLITVVALIASIVVLNLARAGGDPEPTAAPTTEPTSEAPAASEPTKSPTDDDDEREPSDGVPNVEVGPTNTMPIGPWNVTSELSQRFGSTSFTIPDGVNLVLTNDLLNSFPDSCANMRGGWGATKLDNGEYEVLKPEESCREAPELYDEVWGLTDAWVRTIQPA